MTGRLDEWEAATAEPYSPAELAQGGKLRHIFTRYNEPTSPTRRLLATYDQLVAQVHAAEEWSEIRDILEAHEVAPVTTAEATGDWRAAVAAAEAPEWAAEAQLCSGRHHLEWAAYAGEERASVWRCIHCPAEALLDTTHEDGSAELVCEHETCAENRRRLGIEEEPLDS